MVGVTKHQRLFSWLVALMMVFSNVAPVLAESETPAPTQEVVVEQQVSVSQAPVVTDAPAAPVVTDEPAAPVVTDAPAAPVVTDEPAAPVVTDEPGLPPELEANLGVPLTRSTFFQLRSLILQQDIPAFIRSPSTMSMAAERRLLILI